MNQKLFSEEETPPSESEIKKAIGKTYSYLKTIRNFLNSDVGETKLEWKYY